MFRPYARPSKVAPTLLRQRARLRNRRVAKKNWRRGERSYGLWLARRQTRIGIST
jgi:hypothetical protein